LFTALDESGNCMNRLERRFSELRRARRKALIAYMTAGYPSLAESGKTFRTLEKAGVDVVELGVPFSDPIADGPTIQFSSQKALEKGVTLDGIIGMVSRLRRTSQTPIVLMSYLNPIHSRGYARFARAAAEAGVDGLIVPDLIPEEAGELRKELRRRGMDLIHLVAPTTAPARQRRIAGQTQGFLYAVSVTGVTGARKSLPAETAAFLKNLRRASRVPVALGFGISGPEQARRYGRLADGVIFGSALVQRLRDRKPVYPFVKSMRDALDK
jgi:tryptophan synthase alpha chain